MSIRNAVRPSKGGKRSSSTRSDMARTATALTANGTSNPFDIRGVQSILGTIVTSSVTGTTPTLTVALEVSPDGGSTWFEEDRIPVVITGNGTVRYAFDCVGAELGRWRYDVGGTTPSFTLAITALDTKAAR
jgi:hypothetical protein